MGVTLFVLTVSQLYVLGEYSIIDCMYNTCISFWESCACLLDFASFHNQLLIMLAKKSGAL